MVRGPEPGPVRRKDYGQQGRVRAVLMLLTTIWAYGHILSAMAWLGGGILFSFFVGGKLRLLSPPSLREFLIKILPGVLRFFQAVAGATVLFGLLLVANMADGNYAQFSHPTGWALAVVLGMIVALIAFVVSEFVAVPAFRKLVRLAQSVPEGGSGMPPEFPRAAQRAGATGLLTVILLLITLGFMVAAGFY